MTLFDLTGNVALVTGATKGIGRGVVERLCEHGANVVVSSRNQAECDEVARELNERYGDGKIVAIGVAADLLDLSSLARLVESAVARFGRIDTLVCNAAVLPYVGPSAATPSDQFSRVLEGNIQNTFRLCQMVLPDMRERKSGSVVIIGSLSGINAEPEVMAYGLSKAAQIHMAKCLAAEVVGDRVRVNAVSPGITRTSASTPLWQDPQILQPFIDAIPLGRIGEPDDIAGGVIFLASAAGSHITGASIAIAGGSSTVPVPSQQSTLDNVFSTEHSFN